jgi:hypothetical protein
VNALLLAAWLVVTVRTARGSATGRLFLPMAATAPSTSTAQAAR